MSPVKSHSRILSNICGENDLIPLSDHCYFNFFFVYFVASFISISRSPFSHDLFIFIIGHNCFLQQTAFKRKVKLTNSKWKKYPFKWGRVREWRAFRAGGLRQKLSQDSVIFIVDDDYILCKIIFSRRCYMTFFHEENCMRSLTPLGMRWNILMHINFDPYYWSNYHLHLLSFNWGITWIPLR